MAEIRRAMWPWVASAGLALLIVWSYHGTQVDPGALLGAEGRSQIATYVAKLFPPEEFVRMM